jgi:hypothetical protein
MKHEKTDHRIDSGNGRAAREIMAAADKAFTGQKREPYLAQAAEMLRNGSGNERKTAKNALVRMALKGNVTAIETVISYCSDALGGGRLRERKDARSILMALSTKTDSAAARRLLEADLPNALADFDIRTMLFLGMNGREEVSNAVDRALEELFGRLEKERKLDAIAYIAGMSSCSRETKMRAAKAAASLERRRSNLQYIHDTTDDLEIKNMMKEALSGRGLN